MPSGRLMDALIERGQFVNINERGIDEGFQAFVGLWAAVGIWHLAFVVRSRFFSSLFLSWLM